MQFNEVINKYNLEKHLLINKENVNDILNKIERKNYIEELKEGRLGQRLVRDMELNGNINIRILLSWIFFVENAIKFIMKGKNYFEEIILPEYIENNFLFKMKKGKTNKSIGFFFGLYEESKEECFITEYSIQQTSLEQIFNKFSLEQDKKDEEENNNYVLIDDYIYYQLVKR